MEDHAQFRRIYDLVVTIPPGIVLSYGQVGRAVGCNARTVGWALANVPNSKIPWHRVVGAGGVLITEKRSTALYEAQRTLLERDGVTFASSKRVNMDRHAFLGPLFRFASGEQADAIEMAPTVDQGEVSRAHRGDD